MMKVYDYPVLFNFTELEVCRSFHNHSTIVNNYTIILLNSILSMFLMDSIIQGIS
jgi:hypothetical protein